MSQNPHFELVSFDICPYVQRSVIMLKHKKVDFKITFIDLEKPPEWFTEMSPLGKVPLLLVRDSTEREPTVLFESIPIGEYIDEVTPPSVSSKNPLERARENAWIAVSSELLMSLFTMMMASEESEMAESRTELWETLSQVEKNVEGGKYFSARGFSLVDAAFAPVFMRMFMLKTIRDSDHWQSLPKTQAWAKALLELPEVRDSVGSDFKERYVSYLTQRESAAVGDLV